MLLQTNCERVSESENFFFLFARPMGGVVADQVPQSFKPTGSYLPNDV